MFKRAYGLYQERGYRTRLLAAAYRHRLHWTELVGGDVVMTIPTRGRRGSTRAASNPKSRIDIPVEQAYLDDLLARVPDFRRAYEPDGLTPSTSSTRSARPRGRCARSSRGITH